MGDPTREVECSTHGKGYATYVCQHLARGEANAFITGDDDGDNRPDAWCEACDEVLISENGWTDKSEEFAGVTMVCSGCYDEIRGTYL
ncbi:MAG: hypothetical protein ACYTGH_04285 [Planctomycetota bacterium]